MYLDTYLAVIVWIFAIFGFSFFVIKVFQNISSNKHSNRNNFSIIISAKNQQEVIEGLVRNLILNSASEGKDDILLNLVLLDAGSHDDTPKILHRLARDYCFIRIIKPAELGSFIEKVIDSK